ncbi:MAG: GNAT family N-acetyltransferase [Bacilli bacterium]|nr:GNAT family N-acetyltransferase [Bacilli bacterium]
MNYTIENLSLENSEEYARVNALAWKESYKGIINEDYLNFINTEEEIQKLIGKTIEGLNDDSVRSFVLRVDDKAVGIVRVGKSRIEDYPDYGELYSIYLLDSVKKQGYGKVLFEKAKAELKDMGYTKMINGCIEGNKTNEFYQHMGGVFVYKTKLSIPNGQIVDENIYCYKKI